MLKLKSLQIIEKDQRNSGIDIFRSIAILAVVIFHFNSTLPYGYLGVDLFFVISGLLVGGLLTKSFRNGEKISYPKFLLQRGFKIWPSYYVFLLLGNIIAYLFYHESNPSQYIRMPEWPRYIFFYQNYTGEPFRWSFGHVWSLCIEEHFYIILPVVFLTVQYLVPPAHKIRSLFIFVLLMIAAGIAFKFLSLYFTNSKDTYAGTHCRIDSLAWGVLLNLVLSYYGPKLKQKWIAVSSFLAGAVLFVALMIIFINFNSYFFEKVYFHSLMPLAFALMLLGSYYVNFRSLKVLRVIAYYSYNWYLWHPIFVIIITSLLGNTVQGLLAYLLVTFVMAVLATILIEEPVLARRTKILARIFPAKRKVSEARDC